MPIKFINGCSNEVKRNALSDICPNEEKPIGETKYKIKQHYSKQNKTKQL